VAKTREIEKRIEISAPIEAVWKALTDAEELMRWFPLDARSTPGPGGSIWYSWGPPYEGESRIEIWDPPRRIRLAGDWGHAKSETSQKVAGHSPEQVAMDFVLEGETGKTVLRLVHSGFNAGAEWDDEFEGTNRGWDQELLGLKHYLENHAGQNRRAVWARTRIEASKEEVWNRVLCPAGLNLEGLKEGASFDRTTSSHERLQGRVLRFGPPGDFCAVLENWNNAFFRLSVEKSSKPRFHAEPHLWLSTYGLMNFQVMSIQTNWTRMLVKLFPQELEGNNK
jgi:uncharacterized protein YndB with AHSA1/START domain